MKLGIVLDSIIVCGGVLTCYEYIKELKKRGYEADIYANGQNEHLATHYGFTTRPISDLSNFTDSDVIICAWWPQADLLEQYNGRKYQFIQGNDLKAYIGDDWKQKCFNTRQRSHWGLIAVSDYAGEWTGREYTVIPNGLAEQFLSYEEVPKDIDILIEGCAEAGKCIEESMAIAKQVTSNIMWLAREADARFGTQYTINPPQKDIPNIYARSKILLKLSKSEGFSLPCLEAMSQNCACVTREMGGNDFCQYNYNCVKPARLKEVLDNAYLRELLCRAGKETAKQYTWEKSTDKLLELFRV